ncbi:hypothetical protein FI667_g14005, partial [Globisporangium splendens]
MTSRSGPGKAAAADPPPQSNYRLGGANSSSAAMTPPLIPRSNTSSRANTPVLHTATPNAEGGDDMGKKNLPAHVGIGDENVTVVHPREPVAKIPDSEELQCMTCGKHGDVPEMMKCCSCANAFHARCANLPSVPEEGAFFCRWSCFSSFHKRRALGPRELNGDFSKLAEQIQSVLRDIPRLQRGSAERDAYSGAERKRALGHLNGYSHRSSRAENVDANHVDRDADVRAGGHYGAADMQREDFSGRPVWKTRTSRSASRSPSRDFDRFSSHSRHSPALGQVPSAPNSLRSLSRASNEAEYPYPRSESQRKRSKFAVGDMSCTHERIGGVGPVRGSSISPGPLPSGLAPVAAGYLIDGSQKAQVDLIAPAGSQPFTQLPVLFNQHGSSGEQATPPPPRLPMLHTVGARFDQDSVHIRKDSGNKYGTRYDAAGLAAGKSSARIDASAGLSSRSGGRFDDRYSARENVPYTQRDVPVAVASSSEKAASTSSSRAASPKPLNIPWLNPSGFPVELYERFKCQTDDLNRVFRIDLTPAFVDKRHQLHQSEIAFFFRCFESADVTLIVKGMASELNQYIWVWPFILESCGSEAYFTFDHFQYKKTGDAGPALEYVGELKLSMRDYNAYLEKYLSSASGNEAIMLEDHAKKEPLTLLAGNNVIVLNTLVLAKSCTKLYHDLKNSFQWDVFAGGIHCLLQYLPDRCRNEKFSSPLFHFTFPGARGTLCDPGNGTTDTSYQVRELKEEEVLVGCLELVIFERMEPRHRDEFNRILRRAGYHAEKKPMLLESHLHALSSAGFMWTSVKVNDGEFVHINKTGVAIVRTGRFLATGPGGLSQLLSFSRAAAVDEEVVNQKQMQMVLFLESIYPCLEAIVADEYELGLTKDDTELFAKHSGSETMWKLVDADLTGSASRNVNDISAYECGICGLELTNIYKQCLGCTAYASKRRPNVSYASFRMCLRCHAHPKHHHFKSRAIHGYYGQLLSSEGHTGSPPSMTERGYLECRCTISRPCDFCGGCQACSCVCHTRFQTRFRFLTPEGLNQLRLDVDEVIKLHKQTAH